MKAFLGVVGMAFLLGGCGAGLKVKPEFGFALSGPNGTEVEGGAQVSDVSDKKLVGGKVDLQADVFALYDTVKGWVQKTVDKTVEVTTSAAAATAGAVSGVVSEAKAVAVGAVDTTKAAVVGTVDAAKDTAGEVVK